MQRQPEQPQLQRPQSVPREEVLVVELLLLTSFHQEHRLDFDALRVFMVVHLGLS